MATYTITTAVNIDTLASKVGSDTYNINGGYLTVDQHTRYGTNQNTSAGMGNITLSATLGGTIEFNSTLVRLIPYDTGSGNVPALDTTISKGSASGKLLGVYSALNVAPTAAGNAMPATGFILIRQWNSVAFTTGSLTGITANATAADGPGWLEIVGVDALTVTANRLGLFKVRGDYYYFQGTTTSGTRATTYQIPSNGSSVYVPGVEVETSAGSNVYQFYPNAGSMTALVANIATDEVRGRWCWISTAGLVRFGHDGTNSTGGYCPTSGRKIRVPNIFFVTCTAAALTTNALPNATLGTRMEFSTTGGGVIDIDKACINWYCNFAQPYSVTLSNCSTFSSIILSECASPITWTNVGIGQEAATSNIALTMSLNFAGGTMTNCTWTRAAQAASGTYINSWTGCDGFTVTNERTHSLTKAANATSGTATLTRVTNTTWNAPVFGGGRFFMTTCTNTHVNDAIYYDRPANTTSSTIPMYAFDIQSSCVDCTFNNLSYGGLTLVQPYSGILNIGAAGCTNIALRDLGTPASPLLSGGAFVADATWSRTTTTMTITKTAHGLKTGDSIAYLITSDVTPNAVTTSTATLEAVASAPTADTFTITVTNSGATSGTCSYYPCMAGTLVNLANGAAANNVKIQRCYTPHLRTGVMVGDNSSKNIKVESVWGNIWGAQLVPELNCEIRGLLSSPALTAQTSVYGTHFLDYYTQNTTPNTSAVSWSRTTTTATVTSNNHGMRTGDKILVTVSSSEAAIVLGSKTITAKTSNAFTFTCLNAGDASGTLTFVPLNGRVVLQMNEPTSDTTPYVTTANGAAFTSAGSIYMPTVGHEVNFTFPTNIKGHSSFPIMLPVMGTATISNFDLKYSVDNGASYKNLYYPRAGGGGSNASTNVTMTSTTGVAIGDYVFGTNIAPLAKVSSITDGTTIVVDKANIGTVSGILAFTQLPNETISDALVGIPFRVRITTSTAHTTAMTYLGIFTTSNDSARTAEYPLELTTLTLTGLVSGSDIVVLQPGTSTEYANTDSNSGSTYSFVYDPSTITSADIAIYKAGYVPYFIRNLTLTEDDASIPVAQVADRAYT